jgi:hypothetical protein
VNYSQRKYLERLMASAPSRDNDPLGIWPSRMFGLDIIESPDRPRYTLPVEVMPGVPWPAGFREDINRWSRSFLGTTNLVPRGTAYVLGNGMAVMRPSDIMKLSSIV